MFIIFIDGSGVTCDRTTDELCEAPLTFHSFAYARTILEDRQLARTETKLINHVSREQIDLPIKMINALITNDFP